MKVKTPSCKLATIRGRIIKNETRVTTNSEESMFFLWYTSFLTQVKKISNIEYLRMMPIS